MSGISLKGLGKKMQPYSHSRKENDSQSSLNAPAAEPSHVEPWNWFSGGGGGGATRAPRNNRTGCCPWQLAQHNVPTTFVQKSDGVSPLNCASFVGTRKNCSPLDPCRIKCLGSYLSAELLILKRKARRNPNKAICFRLANRARLVVRRGWRPRMLCSSSRST